MKHCREPQQLEASSATGPREWHHQPNRALQTFDHVSVGGNSRSHFGNFYQNVYYGTRKRSQLAEDGDVTHAQKRKRLFEEEKLAKLLESLEFEGMESRLETISPAHAETCHWIFRTPQYLRWQDDAHRHQNHGLLWIKGHPGSGKSTLMKHALRVASENAASRIIAHFFFDAQGSRVQEKCVEGMYRSLLYQILQVCPRLGVGLGMSASQNWPADLLKSMLRNVIRSLKPEDSLTCFIDALDECIEDEIRDAVAFFEDLGDMVVTNNVRFHLCLSSRHFPHITMRKHEELKLDTQTEHLADIVQFSRTKLSWLDLADSTMHDILTEIRDRCSGVFFWAALVIKILKERYDCGATNSELMYSLKQVPDGLEQLLARILRNPDEALIECFQWVLFAGEYKDGLNIPSLLTVQELYFAIKISTGQLATGKWDRHEIDIGGMKRFIKRSSRGLIESPAYSGFRFIHESIEEYLRTGGLARLMNIEQNALKGASHSRFAQLCLGYLKLDASKYLSASEQMSTISDTEFPLLSHAREYALQHMEVAYQQGVLKPEDIWCVPLELLVCALNCRSQQDPRLWSFFDEQIFFNDPATLLYLLLKFYCRGLAKAMLVCRGEATMKNDANETKSDVVFDIDAICSSDRGSALSLAVGRADIELVRILLDQGAATNARVESRDPPRLLETVMRSYQIDRECHVECGNDGLLLHAVTGRASLNRFNEMAELLLDRGAPVDEWQTYSPIHWAAISSNIEMVRSLLKHGANVDARHGYTDTPLIGAAQCWPIDEIVIETLLQSGADVNAVTASHNRFSAPNALIFACETDQENIVKLLLRYGANPHHRNKPLKTAAFEGRGYLFRPDGTALSIALAKRNVNVARIIWQAENDSPTSINANSGRNQTGEWEFVRSGRASQYWDDTKSESSGMSKQIGESWLCEIQESSFDRDYRWTRSCGDAEILAKSQE